MVGSVKPVGGESDSGVTKEQFEALQQQLRVMTEAFEALCSAAKQAATKLHVASVRLQGMQALCTKQSEHLLAVMDASKAKVAEAQKGGKGHGHH